MKILVASDSHGNSEILNNLRNKRFDVTYFLHLGDSCIPKYLLDSYSAVRGNCDFIDLPRFKEIEIEGLKIHMEHGDGFRLNFDKEKYIKELNCDIFLSGHTHKKLATKVGDTYVFNPGSLTRPRDGEKGSYLILEVENNTLKHFEFVEI